MAVKTKTKRRKVRRKRVSPPPSPKKIGFLVAASEPAWEAFVDAFEQQLEQLGWEEGTDFTLRKLSANGKKDDYRKHAKEFKDKKFDIIVTAGTEPIKAVIEKVQASPPLIVVASAARAGTIRADVKVTGFKNGQVNLAGDRLKVFKEALRKDPLNNNSPRLTKVAVMANEKAENAAAERDEVMRTARKEGVTPFQVDIPDAAEEDIIVTKINSLRAQGVNGLYVCTDPLITRHKDAINTAANAPANQLPTMYQFRDHVLTGGLMSYGPNFTKMFRDAAAVVSRALNNKEPRPIADPDHKQLEVVWNTKTAVDLCLPAIPDNFKGVIIG
jgi:putative ABC transport system substrate-binding protein